MNSSSEFQTEFCRIVSLCIVNVQNVWKCIQRLKTHDLRVCVCVGGCVCTRMCFIFHLHEHRLNVKLPADRKLFVRFPFLVYVSRAKILHQCVPGDKRPHWNTKETKRTHTCMNNIRVVRRGKKKKKKALIHMHKSLGTSMQGMMRNMLMNNKHNKSQVSDNHSNDDNHRLSKQRENKVWANYMMVNSSHTGTQRELSWQWLSS